MNYSEMSDFGINKAVGEALGRDLSGINDFNYSVYNITDYCNSWADAGPMIEQNSISLSFGIWVHPSLSGLTMASAGKYSASSENPLRAAMIVFLMMREINND